VDLRKRGAPLPEKVTTFRCLRCQKDGELAAGIRSIAKKSEEDKQHIEKLEKHVDALGSNVGDLKKQLQTHKEPPSSKWIKLLLLPFAVLLAYLMWKGLGKDASLSISFDVGDIVGGFLVGAAALYASITYASKRKD
jgi:hypothetical protein